MKLEPQSALGGAFGSMNAVGGFRSEKAVLKELSDIGCVSFSTASNAAQVELPNAPGEVCTSGSRTALWLSPRSWLIQCRVDDEAALAASLNETFQDKSGNAVPFTDALCWFELSGPGALEYLIECSFISLELGGLPIGHAKRTLIAQIAAVVVRHRHHTWQVAVERSRARYFADWLAAISSSYVA